MKDLLTSILASLQLLTAVESYITPDENWIPADMRLPCVGVKDGGVSREESLCGGAELTITIRLVGFVRMGESGADAVSEVFDLVDTAADQLLEAWPGYAGCQGVEWLKDLPSELIQTENGQWIVKLARHLAFVILR